jgi:hypothetical protein
MPSVAMKGATLKRVTSVPLMKPTSVPTPSEARMTNQTCGYTTTSKTVSCHPCSRVPATTPDRPTVDPTDRSMPPLRITKSMPSARIAL